MDNFLACFCYRMLAKINTAEYYFLHRLSLTCRFWRGVYTLSEEKKALLRAGVHNFQPFKMDGFKSTVNKGISDATVDFESRETSRKVPTLTPLDLRKISMYNKTIQRTKNAIRGS